MNRPYTLVAVLFLALGSLFGQTDWPLPAGEPPQADPDKCYAICLIPNEYETVVKQVETNKAGSRTIVALPTYETVRSQIMVKPASVKLVAVAAEYETVTETIVIQPETKRFVYEPAVFEEYEDRVMISEGSMEYSTTNAKFTSVTNSMLYFGDENGFSKDYGNILDPNNPYHPDKPDSPFNPNNPNSVYNPNNPNSPLNPLSPYNTDNRNKDNSLLNPNNPDSPFNPDFVAKNGIEAATKAANDVLMEAGAGTILPYLIREARVEIETMPMEYETVTEEIEVVPAYKTLVNAAVPCETGDCVTWCEVEMPAEYRTVSRRVAKACANGYTAGSTQLGGEENCIRLKYIPAEYGARSIMVAGAEAGEKKIEAKYRTIKRKRLVKEATVREEVIPAITETITKRVVKRDAYTKKEIIPAEYKTVTQRFRTGLVSAGYLSKGGTLILPTEFEGTSLAPGEFPTMVYPATGYTLPEQTVKGSLGDGPDVNGKMTGGQIGTINTDAGRIPGGLPENYYTAGCPEGFRFDPLDNTCKQNLEIPAEYEAVSTKKLAKKGGVSEWREVLCPNKVSEVTIRALQRALNERGYDAGPADNVMGARTKAALTKFQRENNLPIGGMNMATLQALGLR